MKTTCWRASKVQT